MTQTFENFILNNVINNDRNDFIVLGGRPAMGKTAFIATAAKILSLDNKIPTAVFSLECTAVQFVKRIIGITSDVPSERVKSGEMSDYEIEKINLISEMPLYIDDTPTLDISEMKSQLQSLVIEHGVRYVLVDYLQLLRATQDTIREKELRYICQSLKSFSEEFQITIIAASQCSRYLPQLINHIPTLKDLPIYSIAKDFIDVVWLLYRPSYYQLFEDEQGHDITDIAGLHIYEDDTKILETEFTFDKTIPKFI